MYFKQKQQMAMRSALFKVMTLTFVFTLPVLPVQAATTYTEASVASAENQIIESNIESMSTTINNDIEKQISLKKAKETKSNVQPEISVAFTEVKYTQTHYTAKSEEAYKAPKEVVVTTDANYTKETYFDNGGQLTKSAGVYQGPSGKETYYNLPMDGVVNIMRNAGFSEEEYPYWVREDGVKMLGPYVMVAANLQLRPRGSLVESSLGTAIVCDTGGFAANNSTQLDIAVSW